jgi:hypothetical protein
LAVILNWKVFNKESGLKVWVLLTLTAMRYNLCHYVTVHQPLDYLDTMGTFPIWLKDLAPHFWDTLLVQWDYCNILKNLNDRYFQLEVFNKDLGLKVCVSLTLKATRYNLCHYVTVHQPLDDLDTMGTFPIWLEDLAPFFEIIYWFSELIAKGWRY